LSLIIMHFVPISDEAVAR